MQVAPYIITYFISHMLICKSLRKLTGVNNRNGTGLKLTMAFEMASTGLSVCLMSFIAFVYSQVTNSDFPSVLAIVAPYFFLIGVSGAFILRYFAPGKTKGRDDA